MKICKGVVRIVCENRWKLMCAFGAVALSSCGAPGRDAPTTTQTAAVSRSIIHENPQVPSNWSPANRREEGLAGHRIVKRLGANTKGLRLRGESRLFQDHDGTYWIVSWRTVYRYDSKHDRLDEFELSHDVDQMVQSGDKRIWACGSRKSLRPGLSFFNGNQWESPNISFSFDTVIQGSGGRLLFVVRDKLVAYDNGTWTEPVKVMAGYTTFEAGGRDSEGYLWLADTAIGRYDETNREWTRYTTTEQLGFASQVSLVYEDRLGRIWVGCVKGDVAVYDKRADSWRVYKLKDHVPANLLADWYGYVGLDSIYQDKTGIMFFGTWRGLLTLKEEGLSSAVRLPELPDLNSTHRRIDSPNEWKIYTSKNSPLRGDHVTSILEDQGGAIWIGTNEEIIVLQ